MCPHASKDLREGITPPLCPVDFFKGFFICEECFRDFDLKRYADFDSLSADEQFNDDRWEEALEAAWDAAKIIHCKACFDELMQKARRRE